MTNGAPHKVAVLMLLPQCNMTCDYCVIDDRHEPFPESALVDFLPQLKSQGYTHVIFGGGEPTIWPGDLLSHIKLAKSLGFFVQIGTNGIKVNESYFESENIDRWIVPLDSHIEEIHNTLRKYKKSHYQIMVNVLDQLKKHRRPVYLSTVVTRVNKDTLPEMVQFLNHYNENTGHLVSWNLYRLLNYGRGPEVSYEKLQIPDEEFNSIVRELKSINRNFKITVRRNMYGSDNVDFFVYKNQHIEKQRKMTL